MGLVPKVMALLLPMPKPPGVVGSYTGITGSMRTRSMKGSPLRRVWLVRVSRAFWPKRSRPRLKPVFTRRL